MVQQEGKNRSSVRTDMCGLDSTIPKKDGKKLKRLRRRMNVDEDR
jgi:hypothetical protein